jgi:hypothetical protein
MQPIKKNQINTGNKEKPGKYGKSRKPERRGSQENILRMINTFMDLCLLYSLQPEDVFVYKLKFLKNNNNNYQLTNSRIQRSKSLTNIPLHKFKYQKITKKYKIYS